MFMPKIVVAEAVASVFPATLEVQQEKEGRLLGGAAEVLAIDQIPVLGRALVFPTAFV